MAWSDQWREQVTDGQGRDQWKIDIEWMQGVAYYFMDGFARSF